MNCNITIDTQDLYVGQSIASAIRESTPGGLPGLQVLALPHEGTVEIACNVESVKRRPSSHMTAGEPWPSFSIDGQPYCHAPASLISARVTELARRQGIRTKGTAVVGFTPLECRDLAELAISQGIAEFWKEQHKIWMWNRMHGKHEKTKQNWCLYSVELSGADSYFKWYSTSHSASHGTLHGTVLYTILHMVLYIE